MNKRVKILFAGDYFPGWHSSMKIWEKLTYITKRSHLSHKDRIQMINKTANLRNSLLMTYYLFNAKINALTPLALLQNLFKKYDLNCINLETTLSNIGNPIPEKDYNLRCEPFYIDGLISSYINFVILANNHILDYGENSVKETITLLEKYNINYSGIKHENQSDAQKAVIRNINGINIGFLSYVDPLIIDPYPEVYFNQKLYPYKLLSEQIIEDIIMAKSDTDIVFVNVHWGDEWSHMENNNQIDLAHKMIDSGATAIIGHHPHVIQGIEKYKNGVIAYSLGNLFMYLGGISGIRCNKSFLLDVEVSKSGIDCFDILPISHNMNGQPYLDDCINTEDLDLGFHGNNEHKHSFFFSKIKNAYVHFLKNNQPSKGEWNNEFKVDRIFSNSAWSKNSAYVACGKEFSGKNIKPSVVCNSGEFNEISIVFPKMKISEDLNFYFGYPDWYNFTNHSAVEIILKFGEQIIYDDKIIKNNYLNIIPLTKVIKSDEDEKDLTVTLKREESSFTCLFGIETSNY